MGRDMREYKLVIFDDEGTLSRTRSGEPNRKTPDDWQLHPDVLPKLSLLRASGVKIGIASNKGGVAFGYQRAEEVQEQMYALGWAVKADAVRWCCHHPDGHVKPWAGPCLCRKPRGGMLAEIMQELGVGPEETLMVGDRPEDKGAALQAGCDFMLAADFFDRELPVEVVRW
jgi:D-glycero-D-manno-heptose 1,7-bisphosphate phosphatase